MNSENPIGTIEIGNIHIKCVIFRLNNSIPEILSTSVTRSDGVHNGVIINLKKASNAIRQCIGDSEKKAKVMLKKINVILEQPEFLSTKFSKHKKIDGSKIDKDDIDFLLKEAKKHVIHNDDTQSIIHIFNHNYIVDRKTFLEEPIGVYADTLSHEMTFITMPKNYLKNIKQAFIECDIEIDRVISSIFSLGAHLLTNSELKAGSIIIDLGYEKTSLGIFKNLAPVHSFTLPIGVNHITKDISKVCSLTIEESEIIRNEIDFSFEEKINIFDENGFLKNFYFKTSNFRKISEELLYSIIKARLNEIFEILKTQINFSNSNYNEGLKFFITGGGANLNNLEKYFSNFFQTNVKNFQRINEKANKKDSINNFIACFGAIKIINDGWETEAIPKTSRKNVEKISFFSKFFGNKQ